MFCTQCGAQNDENSYKCIKCGTVLCHDPTVTAANPEPANGDANNVPVVVPAAPVATTPATEIPSAPIAGFGDLAPRHPGPCAVQHEPEHPVAIHASTKPGSPEPSVLHKPLPTKYVWGFAGLVFIACFAYAMVIVIQTDNEARELRARKQHDGEELMKAVAKENEREINERSRNDHRIMPITDRMRREIQRETEQEANQAHPEPQYKVEVRITPLGR